MFNYNNKIFKSAGNTENGEVNCETLFHYQQQGNMVTATYAGGGVVKGHLIAVADSDGALDMRYHHVNQHGALMTGVCRSVPETMPNGKIRLREKWQWTSGDHSAGESVVEECGQETTDCVPKP